MKVRVHIISCGKAKPRLVVVARGSTVLELMKKLGLQPDAWIAVRRNVCIPIDSKLSEREELKLIATVSGG